MVFKVTILLDPLVSSVIANEVPYIFVNSFKVYNPTRALEFMDRGRFDLMAALTYPDADLEHLETCLIFYYWAFSVSDCLFVFRDLVVRSHYQLRQTTLPMRGNFRQNLTASKLA